MIELAESACPWRDNLTIDFLKDCSKLIRGVISSFYARGYEDHDHGNAGMYATNDKYAALLLKNLAEIVPPPFS